MCIKWIAITLKRGATIMMLVLLASNAAWGKPMTEVMTIAPGDQQVLDFSGRVTKVATSDPKVAAVTVSGNSELLVTAKQEGSAVLSVWVQGRHDPLRSTLVVARTAGNRLPFGTQVQTDIRILEVSKTELNKLGFYYGNVFNGGNNAVGIAPPGGGGFRGMSSTRGSVGSAAVDALGNDGFNFFGLGRHSLAIIQALEAGGFAYTLAEPSLTCLSGQSASFLSGGEFPVPVRSNNNGIQVEFKQFGVGLSLTPTVISSQQIILKVAPEVSELDFSAGVNTGGVAVPGLRVRRAETTVSLAPGQTFIISGLVSRNTINNSDRVPGLGSIPLLGMFFRSSQIQREDKEMVMMVTPHLVSPGDVGGSKLPLPGAAYHDSSLGWLDMATQTKKGSQPLRHGLSW